MAEKQMALVVTSVERIRQLEIYMNREPYTFSDNAELITAFMADVKKAREEAERLALAPVTA